MSTRPKILMLTTQLGYGGAETSFIRLANFLAQSMDVTVALFTSDYGQGSYSGGHEPLNASITLLDAPTSEGHIARWYRRIRTLRQLKAQHSASISFLSGPNLVNVLAGHNTRSIVSIRGSRHYDPNAPVWQRRIFQHLLDPIIFRLAARIVPVSAGLTNEIRAAAGARALTKTHIIPPFIDTASLPTRLAETPPPPYDQLQGQPVIVAVGRLSVEKNFHHLLRVFAGVARVNPGAKLLLIGDGPMMQDLRAQCARLGLAADNFTPGTSAVIFAGYQKNPLPLMALGRVYAMTSATEGFPNVVLEALSAGLHVLAADTPWGARAILCNISPNTQEPYPTTQPTSTDHGTLMPRIDLPEYASIWVSALSRALNAPRQSSARAQDFDITRIAPQWLQLITNLIPTTDTGPPIIYMVNPTVAVTGAFTTARTAARLLKDHARIVLVLPTTTNIPPYELTDFWRVDYQPMIGIAKNFRSLLFYFPSLVRDSWQLKQRMRRDGATRLWLNDFYLMHGAMLRLLCFRGQITSWVRCNPSHLMGPLARPLLWFMQLSSNRIVAVSHYVQSLLPMNSKTQVIYDCYDGTPAPRKTFSANSEKTFIFIGNYIIGKGQDVALTAFASAALQDPTLKLAFYGSDMGLQKNRDYRASLAARINELNLAARVVLYDFAPDTTAILSDAYAALNCSISESFSMTVLEAQGAGVPVIATASGGPQEIIRDGITGYLVPVGDHAAITTHILTLAADPTLANRMGQEAAEHVRANFPPQRLQEEICKLLDLN